MGKFRPFLSRVVADERRRDLIETLKSCKEGHGTPAEILTALERWIEAKIDAHVVSAESADDTDPHRSFMRSQ